MAIDKQTPSKAAALKTIAESNGNVPQRFINPLSDFGFKRIFSCEEVMKAFLTDLIRPKTPIAEIVNIDKEMTGEFANERGMAYDMRCKTADGSLFLVEMQRGEPKFFSDRILFYLSRSISSQRRKGEKDTKEKDGKEVLAEWDYHLMPVYGIFFQNFHLPGFKPRHVRTIQLKVKETGELFSNKFTAYTLELCDYKGMDPMLCKTKMDYWMYNFANMIYMDELAFQKKQPVFKLINDIAEYAALTPEERVQYEFAEDRYLKYKATMRTQYEMGVDKGREEGREEGMEKGMEKGMKKGREEGIKEGIKQDKIATAKALKEEGIPIETIAKCTGLSIDDIQNL